MVAPSGEQIRIEHGELSAVITQSGAALRDLRIGQRQLIGGFAEDAMADGGRGQILVPWPNRIRDGRYTFAGTNYQLALTEPSRHNASHGLARWVAWTPTDRTPASVRMQYRLMAQTGYPWTLDLAVTYTLDDAGLHVTQEAVNLSEAPAPYASGAHPYLSAQVPVDSAELVIPASQHVVVDDRLLPTAVADVAGTELDFTTARPIGALDLNHGYVGLLHTDGQVECELRDPASGHGVAIWADQHHTCLQVYTGEPGGRRDSIAIEPMTAPADAFNSGVGLQVLEPGARFAADWGIRPL